MRAWIVDGDRERPGSQELGVRLRAVELPEPRPAPGEVRLAGVGLRRVPHGPSPRPGRPGSTTAADRARARDRRALSTRSASRPSGSSVGDRARGRVATRDVRAMPVVPARRTRPVPNARFTGWDADGGFAEFAVVPEAYAYRIPDGVRRHRRRSAALRGDRGLPRPCAGRPCRPGAGWGSTGSALPPTSSPRSRSPRGRPSTCSPGLAQARELATSRWERHPSVTPTTHRPSRWTPPSSSRRRANWCPPALRTKKEQENARPSPASTCPTSPR